MVRVIVDRCSVAKDDYGDWWLEFYVDDIRHAVLVSDVAAQQMRAADGAKLSPIERDWSGEVEDKAWAYL